MYLNTITKKLMQQYKIILNICFLLEYNMLKILKIRIKLIQTQ